MTEAVKERVRVLVADDQPDVVEALRLLLRREGFDLSAASSPAGVLSALGAQDFDAALVDLNYTRDTTSGKEGLDLLSQIRGLDSELPVLVMTAWGSVEGAVEAMRRGARDYVQKPWDNTRLVATLRTQVELGKALRRSRRLEEENTRLRGGAPRLFASSPAMQPVLRLLERVGPSDANVLVTGEHGTGKEVIARFLHDSSKRAGQPLVPVNAGGLSEGVFESELFGHVRGAFTGAVADRRGKFELADGGTIFLDEIGDMSVKTQAKVLRVLQEQTMEAVGGTAPIKVDARVLAATNKDLQAEIRAGRFREDLYFRLNVIPIFVPALRDRQEDVPLLADHFMAEFAREYGRRVKTFEPGARIALQQYPWPGNVRELRNVIERLMIMVPGDAISAADLSFLDPNGLTRPAPLDAPAERRTLHEARDQFERDLILRTLAEQQGNMSRTAEVLGVERSNLYRKMKAFGIAQSRRPEGEEEGV
ncbi:MAG: sigma-54-dependent transcriptional regulator [Myxococcales bacterium]